MLKISTPPRMFLLRRARARHDARRAVASLQTARGSSNSAAAARNSSSKAAGAVQRALANPLMFFRTRGSRQCQKSKAEGPP